MNQKFSLTELFFIYLEPYFHNEMHLLKRKKICYNKIEVKEMTKEEVLQLEKELSFQEFNNHDAYQLGQIIVDHIEKNHLKNVRIRIVLDKILFFNI